MDGSPTAGQATGAREADRRVGLNLADPHAVGRLLLRQIAAARTGLADANPETAVFQARRRLKKARSTLRLARPLLGTGYRRLADRLAAVSRRLGAVRDVDVAAREAGRLVAAFAVDTPVRLALDGFLHRRQRTGGGSHVDDLDFADIARQLRIAEGQAAGIVGTTDPVWLIRMALRDCYRRGRHDYRRVIDGRASEEEFHEWRKRVKTRFHLSKLLPPEAKSGSVKELARLKALAAALGEDHDIAVLEQEIAVDPGFSEEIRAMVARQLHGRRRVLRRHALELGARLYRRKLSAYGERLVARG